MISLVFHLLARSWGFSCYGSTGIGIPLHLKSKVALTFTLKIAPNAQSLDSKPVSIRVRASVKSP